MTNKMTISVLIPTYSYKCYTLVADLQSQLEQAGCDYEIIVAEDGSKDQVSIIHNHRIIDLPHCRHIIRRENVGRAAIRNFLIDEAKGNWLLFIDSDAMMVRNDFAKNYLDNIDCGVDVIVGGLVNPAQQPSPDVSLRYVYEKSCEYQRTVEYRTKYPYSHFSTFNVLVRRDIAEKNRFDENCREYGYEDALLGVNLMNSRVNVKHIDNPLMHVGLESNEVFLRKTHKALRTLKSLGDAMLPYSHLGQFATKLHKYYFGGVVTMAFLLFKPLLHRNLLSASPNMKVFSFYKLGYFLSIK